MGPDELVMQDKKLKILVVDDQIANRQLIQEILRKNADCDMAANGKEAIEACEIAKERIPYDIVLLDISMPEMNGLEFLDYLRNQEQKKGVSFGEGLPVIMVTAYKEEFMKAYNRGCDDYVLKPIDPSILRNKISKIINDRKN